MEVRWEVCAQSCAYVSGVRVKGEGVCIGTVCGYNVLEQNGPSVQLKCSMGPSEKPTKPSFCRNCPALPLGPGATLRMSCPRDVPARFQCLVPWSCFRTWTTPRSPHPRLLCWDSEDCFAMIYVTTESLLPHWTDLGRILLSQISC